MSNTRRHNQLQANKQQHIRTLLKEMVGDLTSQEQITDLSQDLLKTIVETVLNGEMDEHLGYDTHHPSGHNTGNSRHGYYP